MDRFLKIGAFALTLMGFFVPASVRFSLSTSVPTSSGLIKPVLKLKFTNIYDTLFTAKDSYLEVNLKTQRTYHHFRDGRSFEYLCSSGNSKIEKGIETQEGLFVIQYKSKKVYSTQFDSTLLLHWIGFNYGIGFHALLGSSYYRQLGRTAMSHGCIRLSRENCKRIYESVEIGTPVLVHSGSSARVLAFTDQLDRYYIPSGRELKILSQYNLDLLFKGFYLISNPAKIIISEDNISHAGISIGDIRNVPNEQFFIPPLKINNTDITPDKLKINLRNNISPIE